MEKDKYDLENKVDKLIEINLRSLIFSMYRSGYTMDQICKNLRIRKTKVVELLKGLDKKK